MPPRPPAESGHDVALLPLAHPPPAGGGLGKGVCGGGGWGGWGGGGGPRTLGGCPPALGACMRPGGGGATVGAAREAGGRGSGSGLIARHAQHHCLPCPLTACSDLSFGNRSLSSSATTAGTTPLTAPWARSCGTCTRSVAHPLYCFCVFVLHCFVLQVQQLQGRPAFARAPPAD